MTSELVTPSDEHREEIVGLMRVAFNLGSAGLAERAAWLPVEKMRCVLEGDRIVAAAAARDFRQWFGGRELGMSGIWGVVTLPEHRGGGLATRAVTELLVEARAKGQPLSVLYPATQRPYRGMGFELAGTMTRHRGSARRTAAGSRGGR
jgi:predicted acetyltransferase